jgi:hypothetical protein
MKRFITKLSSPKKSDIPKEVVFEDGTLIHHPEEKQYNKYEGWYLLDGQTKEQALTHTRFQDGPKPIRKRPPKKKQVESECQ